MRTKRTTLLLIYALTNRANTIVLALLKISSLNDSLVVSLFLNRVQQNFLESIGDYITDICYLACKHKVKLEAAFINAALACEIMEGLASSLYPDMQVQTVALPMVLKAEMMHGLKGLPSPHLWSLK
ncbi:hypothetical protein ACHAWU_003115 [Discostella pseudostelligera]|uniref:Uncharacterized protein n=1 Tax=Discostella pseudostelligera TaxID=259834 RepID=A0ABD3MRV4_9STRA